VGARVCSARQGGATQATLVSMWASAPRKFAMSAKKFVGTAEKYLCPQFLPQPAAVILSLRGTGTESSRSVVVNQPALRVKYSYDCSSFGGPGSFVADFETANQNSLDFDDQPIANALSPAGWRPSPSTRRKRAANTIWPSTANATGRSRSARQDHEMTTGPVDPARGCG
jgi:hypothetical protein